MLWKNSYPWAINLDRVDVRSSHRRCYVRKGVLRNFAKFTGKNLCQSLFFNKVPGFIKRETLAQVFSCQFCEISKNTFFREHLRVTASKLFSCLWRRLKNWPKIKQLIRLRLSLRLTICCQCALSLHPKNIRG